MKCPMCGAKCEAEFVDIGVGEQRVTPWGCLSCHWTEPALEDFNTEYDEFDPYNAPDGCYPE